MSKVVAEIVVVPFAGGPGGLSRYVASVENTLRSFDLEVMLTPMGTILEGELDEVLKALRTAHEVPFSMGALRVATSIRIDDRRDRELTMSGKIRAVEEKM
ncbi:MAG TPA: MTH1187 family thiamine-binding protein [Synergistales bacterium]|nr:MTH1187 family thiamine-binding protein [Synergistales bacterium]